MYSSLGPSPSNRKVLGEQAPEISTTQNIMITELISSPNLLFILYVGISNKQLFKVPLKLNSFSSDT